VSRPSDVERFDAWAATYDRSLLQRLLFERVHRAVIRALRTSGQRTDIADVGCGTGALALRLAAALPGAHVTGFDPAPRMIDVASRKARAVRRVSFVVAPAAHLPVADAAFDAVVSTMSFHHWDDPDASLREVRRVLRHDGVVLIADVFARGVLGPVLRRARHGHGYATEARLRQVLARAGLRLTGFDSIIPFSAPLAVAVVRAA
jgi:ubiquinone/menaquinone biosynthesis C-methylase UbiE